MRTAARWTTEEDQVMREHWHTKSAKELARILNRTSVAITLHAMKLGLRKNQKRKAA